MTRNQANACEVLNHPVQRSRWYSLCLSVGLLLILPLFVSAQVDETAVAVVGETNIMASRIERHLDRTLGDRELSEEQLQVLRVETLQHFVNREVVNHFLKVRKFKVGPNQVRLEVELLIANLARVGQTLEDFLAKENKTRQGLEHEIAWKLRWDKYLKKTLTEKVLESYFGRHRRKFDGTEVQVAQILFRTLGTRESVDAALLLARKKKAEIENGDITWKEAVAANSVAASKENGGKVGWLRFVEPMPREFTDRAFAMEPDGLAEPFTSAFGVHLIKCLEVRPGTAEWGDVRQEVEEAATKELFDRIADRHQTEVEIEYSEGWKAP